MSGLRVRKSSVRVPVAVAMAAGLLAAAPAVTAGASSRQAPPASAPTTSAPPATADAAPATAPGSASTLLPPAADDDVRILQGDKAERNLDAGPGTSAPAPEPATPGGDPGDGDAGPTAAAWAGLAALALAALGLTAVSAGELRRMLHAWRGTEAPRPAWALPDRPRSGADIAGAEGDAGAVTFSLLVAAVPRARPHHGPAAAEAARALGATVGRLAALDRPDVEVLAVVSQDDHAARRAADEAAAAHLGRVSVVIDRNRHPRRARALDGTLGACRGRVVGVFLPGDEPHPGLLDEVEERLAATGAAAVQAPVQPAWDGPWYAAHQALDRWFWFRSELPYLAERRFMPLATSSVFVRADDLRAHGGWDESAADEGVELGVRLASAGVPQAAIDRPDLATRARPPRSASAAVRAETARQFGTLHAVRRGAWRALPARRQRRRARTTLFQPVAEALAAAVVPLALAAALVLGAPLAVVLLLCLPALPQVTAAVVSVAGAHELARGEGRRMPWHRGPWLLLTAVPYRLLAGAGAVAAVSRYAVGRRPERAPAVERLPAADARAHLALVTTPAPAPADASDAAEPAGRRHPGDAEVVDLDARRQRSGRPAPDPAGIAGP